MRHPRMIAAVTTALALGTAAPAVATTEGSSAPNYNPINTISDVMGAVQDAVNTHAPLPVKQEINKWHQIRVRQGNNHIPYGAEEFLRDAFTPAAEFEYPGYVLLFV